MNFFVVALGLIAVAIPAAPFWEGEEHFNLVDVYKTQQLFHIIGQFKSVGIFIFDQMNLIDDSYSINQQHLIEDEDADRFEFTYDMKQLYREMCIRDRLYSIANTFYTLLV